MSGYRTRNGYEFTPSSSADGLHVEKVYGRGQGGYKTLLDYEYLDSLWAYFKDRQTALDEGWVQIRDVDPVTDKGGLNLWAKIRSNKPSYCAIDDSLVSGLRELYDFLEGGTPASMAAWRPLAAVRAMLSVGFDPEEAEKIWADPLLRGVWEARAKAVLDQIDRTT